MGSPAVAHPAISLHVRNITRWDFRRVIRAAKLPSIRFHDLRHTTATHLLEQGENLKTVSEFLGHSDPGFTLRTYAHVLPGWTAQMMARLQERLFGTEQSHLKMTTTGRVLSTVRTNILDVEGEDSVGGGTTCPTKSTSFTTPLVKT